MARPSEVDFFGTCIIDLLFPKAGLSAMKLLRREGIRVVYPQGQTCCAQPPYNSGFRDEARLVARHQLDVLDSGRPLVVPSASCAGMFRVHYPRLFAGTPDQARAEALAARVVELTELLHRVLGYAPEDLGEPIRVAVHQSCSARREIGSADCARALLDGLANVEVVEPERAEECCGFGGTFSIKSPDISAEMSADKVNALAATGAALVVGQDCGCLMNIDGTARKRHKRLPVKHIAELLWERTEP